MREICITEPVIISLSLIAVQQYYNCVCQPPGLEGIKRLEVCRDDEQVMVLTHKTLQALECYLQALGKFFSI